MEIPTLAWMLLGVAMLVWLYRGFKRAVIKVRDKEIAAFRAGYDFVFDKLVQAKGSIVQHRRIRFTLETVIEHRMRGDLYERAEAQGMQYALKVIDDATRELIKTREAEAKQTSSNA